jgi:hypothetical protein
VKEGLLKEWTRQQVGIDPFGTKVLQEGTPS